MEIRLWLLLSYFTFEASVQLRHILWLYSVPRELKCNVMMWLFLYCVREAM